MPCWPINRARIATLGSGLNSGRTYNSRVSRRTIGEVAFNLTVNLGMRYDFLLHFVATGEGGTPTPDCTIRTPSAWMERSRWGFPAPLSARSGSRCEEFGPRIGFSHNPDGKGKTAIRGGFGAMFINVVPRTSGISYRAPKTSRIGLPSLRRISVHLESFPVLQRNLFNFQQLVRPVASSISGIYNTHLQSPYTMRTRRTSKGRSLAMNSSIPRSLVHAA